MFYRLPPTPIQHLQTISQASDDNSAHAILKPLNEKNAIKRFTFRLRSQRLSFTDAAHNFNNLQEAVQAAQDEKTSTTRGSQLNGRMCFPTVVGVPRAHNEFLSQTDKTFHKGNSEVGRLKYVDSIKIFRMDYLHKVCVGIGHS